MDDQNQQEPTPEPVQPPGPPTPPPPRETDPYIIWGFVLAGLGLFCCCCPALFAIPSIILGAIAYSRGDQRGLWVIIAGVVALLGGFGLRFAAAPFRHQWEPWVPQGVPIPGRRI